MSDDADDLDAAAVTTPSSLLTPLLRRLYYSTLAKLRTPVPLAPRSRRRREPPLRRAVLLFNALRRTESSYPSLAADRCPLSAQPPTATKIIDNAGSQKKACPGEYHGNRDQDN